MGSIMRCASEQYRKWSIQLGSSLFGWLLYISSFIKPLATTMLQISWLILQYLWMFFLRSGLEGTGQGQTMGGLRGCWADTILLQRGRVTVLPQKMAQWKSLIALITNRLTVNLMARRAGLNLYICLTISKLMLITTKASLMERQHQLMGAGVSYESLLHRFPLLIEFISDGRQDGVVVGHHTYARSLVLLCVLSQLFLYQARPSDQVKVVLEIVRLFHILVYRSSPFFVAVSSLLLQVLFVHFSLLRGLVLDIPARLFPFDVCEVKVRILLSSLLQVKAHVARASHRFSEDRFGDDGARVILKDDSATCQSPIKWRDQYQIYLIQLPSQSLTLLSSLLGEPTVQHFFRVLELHELRVGQVLFPRGTDSQLLSQLPRPLVVQ